jgi:hypothetical protein
MGFFFQSELLTKHVITVGIENITKPSLALMLYFFDYVLLQGYLPL